MRIGRVAAWTGLALVVAAGGLLVSVPPLRDAVLAPRPTLTRTLPPAAGSFAPGEVAVPDEPLLPPLPSVAPPGGAALAARLPALPSGVASTRGLVVADPGTSEVLFSARNRPLLPASTMKLVTALAALDVLEPGTRFTTGVVQVGAGRIVLVGGGDPLLVTKRTPGRASLTDLAAATAAALKGQGITKVSLGYDASLFSGPAWNPTWQPAYRYAVAPVSALLADHARTSSGLRASNPAKAAAAAFRARLRARGITVGALSEASGLSGTPLAEVASPPLERVLEVTLRDSDNDAAEVLLRHVALADGRAGTAAEGARVVAERLRARGLWAEGMRIADGSGLSRENRLTPGALVRLVSLALREDALRPLATGLPVGGAAGTLWNRFDDKAERAGRGVVRAKTGTLRDVSTLAGYVVTRDGAVLAYAVLANGVTNIPASQDWIDRTSAALASCGCG